MGFFFQVHKILGGEKVNLSVNVIESVFNTFERPPLLQTKGGIGKIKECVENMCLPQSLPSSYLILELE